MNGTIEKSSTVLEATDTFDDDYNDQIDSDEEGGVRIDEDIYIPPPPHKIQDNNNDGARLIINKIVNTNFKSYAGDVVIGPFNNCFTSIVGPNGSGKSNVIDSMLFVFGYRASKIRSKKVSSLIHNSSQHPNINKCSVTVYFQKIIDRDNDKHDVVPNSDIVISRTAFKDSTSYYELNGQRVHFKEIGKLLRKEGVDLDHNRFLILQGEVEQISMMKPKSQNGQDTGMLEFLEDIIGTTRYKIPLEKLMEKIDYLNEKVCEKQNRLNIVEKERENLREPMQVAVDYLKLENIITKLQHKLCHCKKYDAIEKLNKKNINHQQLENEADDLKKEKEALDKEKDIIHREMKEKGKKWNSTQVKRDEASAKYEEINKTDQAMHAELIETNKRRKINIASVNSENEKLKELSQIPDNNAQTIEEFEVLITRHTTNREKEELIFNELLGSLKEKTEPLMKKRTDLETKLITQRKQLNDAKAKFDLAESELKIYTTVELTEKEKLKNLQETLESSSKTLENRKEQMELLKNKIPTTQKLLDDAKNELNIIKKKETTLSDKLKNMRVIYHEKKCSMNANKSRNKVIESLMKAKNDGLIPGIYGRLGDLGAIDAKYDVAISTACGPLDHVVVDTVDTAQNCIKYLRDNNIGRASFIPLEKQNKFIKNCSQKISTPENVIRLFDLIKVENSNVLPAFYFGLRDTLVTDDLNQATRIAYGEQRYRVVTLKGELIETSGTMSGGGGNVFRGRMGQSIKRNEPTPVEIEKLEADLDVIFNECNSLQKKLPSLEEKVKTLLKSYEEMTINRDKYEIEIKTLSEQVPSLETQLKLQIIKANQAVSSSERVDELTNVVDSTRENLDKIKKQSESLENEVDRINKAIDDLSGGKIKEQQKKITNLDKSIDKAKTEICRLQVAIKTAHRNSQKTREKIVTLEADVKSCEQRIKNIQNEKINLEEQAKILIKEIKLYDESLAERDELNLTLKKQLDELINQETNIKALKIDLDEKLSTSKKFIDELTLKIKDYNKQISNLKLNKIPDKEDKLLTDLTDDIVSQLDARTIAANLAAAKERLPQEIPNMKLIEEYMEINNLYKKRFDDLEKVTDCRNKLRSAYDEAKKRRFDEFNIGFSMITKRLEEMYQMITLGGAAVLELVDSLDPFTEGVVFSVRPPKKSWKNISNLSGGEKTLSSLALVFALHHYKPTPLYFMDEIDAALDFKNVSIVGRYIKERTKNAQFIIISLRAEMFELADTLVGIYKTFNATKCAPIILKLLYQTNDKIAEYENEKKHIRQPLISQAIAVE
ncbi:structural maintenance of chromosomes protein 4-like [Aphidius gifuensis]|uniref:structural maintenance of chromosomes protein 4-like n=1 Tax=Aphidius gifuensis TaxID=684658 RepID=UPI001CDD40D7|nr:structural maintenance of chromosomes protein 4-like [Aphidius gifuensis]